MSTQAVENAGREGLAGFDKTTSVWGPITMTAGLIAMVGGPLVLALTGGYDVNVGTLLTCILAIALAFGVIWIVEPVSYFPILGAGAMYQAFLIGNISTKLLPAAVTAQERVGAKPGTPKAQLTAALAICAAAIIHVVALVLVVGILGQWLLTVIPKDVLTAVTRFVVPSVLGAFLVQVILSNRRYPKVLIAGAVVAAVVNLVLVPLVPAAASFAALFGVVATVAIAVATFGGGAKADDAGEAPVDGAPSDARSDESEGAPEEPAGELAKTE